MLLLLLQTICSNKRCYHLSSSSKILNSEIYGDPNVHPQPESYWGNVNTIGPRVSISLYVSYHIVYRFIYNRISSIYLSSFIRFIRPVMMKGNVWLRQ